MLKGSEKKGNRDQLPRYTLLDSSETQYYISPLAADLKETRTVHACQFCVSAWCAEYNFDTLMHPSGT